MKTFAPSNCNLRENPMSEKTVIDRTKEPLSKADLITDLKALGLKPKDGIILHVSLSSIGWIIGGERTLIEAIQTVITPNGTIVMPSQSGNVSDPAEWENPPVPSAWVEKIRANMPPYHPDLTPTYAIGRVAEYFRSLKSVKRSAHYKNAFAAWGHGVEPLLDPHAPGHAFDEESPLQRMLDRAFKVCLIGTSYDSVTALHYAESQSYIKRSIKDLYYMHTDEQTEIRYVYEFDYVTDEFAAIGQAFEQSFRPQKGLIGQANAKLIRLTDLVPFAIAYLSEKTK